jgi:hypothetical protein
MKKILITLAFLIAIECPAKDNFERPPVEFKYMNDTLYVSSDDILIGCTKDLKKCKEYNWDTSNWEIKKFNNFGNDLKKIIKYKVSVL